MIETKNFFLQKFEGADKFDYKVINENWQKIDNALNELLNGGDSVILPTMTIEKTENGYVITTHDVKGSHSVELPIQEYVDNYFYEHPESTVKDGSLTVEKFTDELKLRTIKDYVTPEMFGAVGDGKTDDTNALNSAIEYCRTNKIKLVSRYKKYLISECVNMRYIDIDIQSEIIISHHGIGLIVGNSSVTGNPTVINLNKISHSEYAEGDISVRIVGLSNGDVSIRKATFIQLYADGDIETDRAIAYSRFNIGTCEYLQITDNEVASSAGWINENTFFNCRVINQFSIEGKTFKHDCNVFYKPCFENAVVYLSNCQLNKFYDVRNESTGKFSLTFDENAEHNYVELGFYFHYPLRFSTAIKDNGINNTVTYAELNALESVPFYNLTPNTVKKGLYEIHTNDLSVTEDNNLSLTKSYQKLLNNVIIPVDGIKYIMALADTKTFIFYATPLDENQIPMDNNPLTFFGVTNALYESTKPTYTAQNYTDYMLLSINDKNVKYLKLLIDNGTKAATFHNLSLVAYYDHKNILGAMELADFLKSTNVTT